MTERALVFGNRGAEDTLCVWIGTAQVWLPEALMPRDATPDAKVFCNAEHEGSSCICTMPPNHRGLHQAGNGEGWTVAIW